MFSLEQTIIRLEHLSEECLTKKQYAMYYVLQDCVVGLFGYHSELKREEEEEEEEEEGKDATSSNA